MKSKTFNYSTKIYYDDTDLNGIVYHPHFLKYFSRAREEIVGFEQFAQLVNQYRQGIGVYKANLKFQGIVKFGDNINITTVYEPDGEFKMIFHQELWVEGNPNPAVIGDFECITIDLDSKMPKKFPMLEGFNPIPEN